MVKTFITIQWRISYQNLTLIFIKMVKAMFAKNKLG